jgi:hypothetical protein
MGPLSSLTQAINVVADPPGAVSAKEQSAGKMGTDEQCAVVGLGPAKLAYALAAMKPLNRPKRVHSANALRVVAGRLGHAASASGSWSGVCILVSDAMLAGERRSPAALTAPALARGSHNSEELTQKTHHLVTRETVVLPIRFSRLSPGEAVAPP